MFGEEADIVRTKLEEENFFEIDETLGRMPSFWQHSEDTADHLHTSYDLDCFHHYSFNNIALIGLTSRLGLVKTLPTRLVRIS